MHIFTFYNWYERTKQLWFYKVSNDTVRRAVPRRQLGFLLNTWCLLYSVPVGLSQGNEGGKVTYVSRLVGLLDHSGTALPTNPKTFTYMHCLNVYFARSYKI